MPQKLKLPMLDPFLGEARGSPFTTKNPFTPLSPRSLSGCGKLHSSQASSWGHAGSCWGNFSGDDHCTTASSFFVSNSSVNRTKLELLANLEDALALENAHILGETDVQCVKTGGLKKLEQRRRVQTALKLEMTEGFKSRASQFGSEFGKDQLEFHSAVKGMSRTQATIKRMSRTLGMEHGPSSLFQSPTSGEPEEFRKTFGGPYGLLVAEEDDVLAGADGPSSGAGHSVTLPPIPLFSTVETREKFQTQSVESVLERATEESIEIGRRKDSNEAVNGAEGSDQAVANAAVNAGAMPQPTTPEPKGHPRDAMQRRMQSLAFEEMMVAPSAEHAAGKDATMVQEKGIMYRSEKSVFHGLIDEDEIRTGKSGNRSPQRPLRKKKERYVDPEILVNPVKELQEYFGDSIKLSTQDTLDLKRILARLKHNLRKNQGLITEAMRTQKKRKKELKHIVQVQKTNFKMEVALGLKKLEDLRFFERISASKRQKNFDEARKLQNNIRRTLAWCFNQLSTTIEALEVQVGQKSAKKTGTGKHHSVLDLFKKPGDADGGDEEGGPASQAVARKSRLLGQLQMGINNLPASNPAMARSSTIVPP